MVQLVTGANYTNYTTGEELIREIHGTILPSKIQAILLCAIWIDAADGFLRAFRFRRAGNGSIAWQRDR